MASFLLMSFLTLVIIGLPIAFSFGASSLLFFIFADSPPVILVSRAFGQIDSFALMAIPFFILCGDLMREGGVSSALVDFIQSFIGRVKGVLAQVTVASSAFFGAISGSGPATVAAIGGIMIPEMNRHGYNPYFSVAVSASSGYLGILIPPSIPFIIYGLNSQTSIGALFLAGTIPGIITALGFMVVNHLIVDKYKKSEIHGDKGSLEGIYRLSKVAATKRALIAIITPVIILGGIYAGIFTPTEAGAVAVVYGFLAAVFYYKGINSKNIFSVVSASSITAGVILILIAFAGVFGWIITTQQIPSMITQKMLSITENRYIILLLINILLLFLGMIMETVAAIVITTPILLPIMNHIGVDPIHFGVILIYNLGVGMITPPMAVNLLVGCKIGKTDVTGVIKPLVPYCICAVLILFLITFVPFFSLWLPSLFGYGHN